MTTLFAVILAMFAGIMNGSYAFPVKGMRRSWPDELIWLIFAVFAFLLMPWIANYVVNSHINDYLSLVPGHTIKLLAYSGVSFGIGMILFTLAFSLVGLGVSFILNIGVSTVLATLLPILVAKPQAFLTEFGALEIVSMIVFIIGVIFAMKAAIARDNIKMTSATLLGLVFGTLSGIFNTGEGFSYSLSLPTMEHIANVQQYSALSSANIAWILIFGGAFIPYFIFFLLKSVKSGALTKLGSSKTPTNLVLLLMMSVFYVVCMFIFSKSTLELGQYGSVIAWPLFMIFIVLTSNFWGLVQGEWSAASKRAKSFLFMSIILLVLAVLILSANGYYNS